MPLESSLNQCRCWLACLLLLCVAACSASGDPVQAPPAPPPPVAVEDPSKVVWNAEPGGLQVVITSSGDLNLRDNIPLGLTLCLLQMEDKNNFDSLSQTAEGLETLQECSPAKAGAVTAREIAMQPGQSRVLVLDRAEKAKFLGVVAGYAHLEPAQSVAVFPFLMYQEESGWIPMMTTTMYRAAPMDIFVQLGASSLRVNGATREQ